MPLCWIESAKSQSFIIIRDCIEAKRPAVRIRPEIIQAIRRLRGSTRDRDVRCESGIGRVTFCGGDAIERRKCQTFRGISARSRTNPRDIGFLQHRFVTRATGGSFSDESVRDCRANIRGETRTIHATLDADGSSIDRSLCERVAHSRARIVFASDRNKITTKVAAAARVAVSGESSSDRIRESRESATKSRNGGEQLER